MEMYNLSILYKSLLNRNPNGNEILKFNSHRNIKIVNKEILISNEYKNFHNETKKNIYKLIKKVFLKVSDIELTIHHVLEFNLFKYLRENNYNYIFLENELTKLFNENDSKLKYIIKKLYFTENNTCLDMHIQNSWMILLTNNFNFDELEFNLVSEPNYLKMVKNKLKNI